MKIKIEKTIDVDIEAVITNLKDKGADIDSISRKALKKVIVACVKHNAQTFIQERFKHEAWDVSVADLAYKVIEERTK